MTPFPRRETSASSTSRVNSSWLLPAAPNCWLVIHDSIPEVASGYYLDRRSAYPSYHRKLERRGESLLVGREIFQTLRRATPDCRVVSEAGVARSSARYARQYAWGSEAPSFVATCRKLDDHVPERHGLSVDEARVRARGLDPVADRMPEVEHHAPPRLELVRTDNLRLLPDRRRDDVAETRDVARDERLRARLELSPQRLFVAPEGDLGDLRQPRHRRSRVEGGCRGARGPRPHRLVGETCRSGSCRRRGRSLFFPRPRRRPSRAASSVPGARGGREEVWTPRSPRDLRRHLRRSQRRPPGDRPSRRARHPRSPGRSRASCGPRLAEASRD